MSGLDLPVPTVQGRKSVALEAETEVVPKKYFLRAVFDTIALPLIVSLVNPNLNIRAIFVPKLLFRLRFWENMSPLHTLESVNFPAHTVRQHLNEKIMPTVTWPIRTALSPSCLNAKYVKADSSLLQGSNNMPNCTMTKLHGNPVIFVARKCSLKISWHTTTGYMQPNLLLRFHEKILPPIHLPLPETEVLTTMLLATYSRIVATIISLRRNQQLNIIKK